MKTWLHTNQLYFVATRVPQTIRQLQAYRWAENVAADGQARKEKVFKKKDELPDALRYALMSWPILPRPAVVETKRDISHLSEFEQATITRMREIEAKATQPEPQTVSDNFWS